MKCIVCEEPAKWRFSPDMDIQGIGACELHKESVRLCYVVLISGDEESFKEMIKNLKLVAKNKKKN